LNEVKSLGIFGGAFDPIHYGHLMAAEYARNMFSLDKVLIIPSARPPHKEIDNISPEKNRYEMVDMAIRDNSFFEISPMEMERKGYSYTIDTIDYCLKDYPGVNIYVIMGADCLFYMDTWKDVERLVTMCKFIVVTRPGYNINKDDKALSGLPSSLWENLIQLQVPGLDISSSEIRERVLNNKPIKYLLPPEVECYIYKHGLYREEGT